ncbi:hypothetical protein, partial [Streptomyces lydicus]|uniref:hypothetical protein n=1 Tax=Streptomyces lydicus TaxID=47763 RepID=UPI0037D6269C
LRPSAARHPGKLDESHLGLVPEQFPQSLEDVDAVWKVGRELSKASGVPTSVMSTWAGRVGVVVQEVSDRYLVCIQVPDALTSGR